MATPPGREGGESEIPDFRLRATREGSREGGKEECIYYRRFISVPRLAVRWRVGRRKEGGQIGPEWAAIDREDGRADDDDDWC